MTASVSENLEAVQQTIAEACKKVNRNREANSRIDGEAQRVSEGTWPTTSAHVR